MRHIPLNELVTELFSGPRGKQHRDRLFKAHKHVALLAASQRHGHIRSVGTRKWSPIKYWLTRKLGNKCWYTEVELVGAPLTIDHFRPVRDYWWLAFVIENYRVACPFSNSPADNVLYGRAGGKKDEFPLLGRGLRATGKNRLRVEKPVILDPCNQADCDLIVFQADGRPVLNPNFAADDEARTRVEESKLLLNLDHPDLNTKRERLYTDIKVDVKTYEQLPPTASARQDIELRLKRRIAPNAQFSSAARCYLQVHRHLPWVEALLQ